MSDVLSQLSAPFPPDRISWRVGSTTQDKKKAMALAYIDARDVQDRLNEVCGPYWQCEHIPSGERKVTCRIGIKIGDEWIWRSNGAGDTDVEGEKGSYSDSFKRAAVMFGIGRYLYDVDSPWVEIEPHGKSYGIKASELPRLRKLLSGNAPAPKSEPKPAGKLALKFPDGSSVAYMDERIWFAELERYTLEDASMWQLNVDTARKLAKESDEWKAWGKKIAGLLAPMAG